MQRRKFGREFKIEAVRLIRERGPAQRTVARRAGEEKGHDLLHIDDGVGSPRQGAAGSRSERLGFDRGRAIAKATLLL
jgi:hypothetical protein